MYDQNRPEEPPRQPGDEQPARRRLGRSWAPAEEAAEADEQPPQGPGQPPEQYRFDPDRGRRHRYSEGPTDQMPNVPVEIAETGPTVPATRRPNAGEQFEPIPPVPPQPQGQPESPFAPPGANSAPSAPPGANGAPSAPPGPNHAPNQAGDNGPGAPPGPNVPAPPGAPEAGPSSGPANFPGSPQGSGQPGPSHAPSAPRTPAQHEPPAPQQTPAPGEAPGAPQQQYSAPQHPASPPRPPAAQTPAPQIDPAEQGLEHGPRTGPIPVPEGRQTTTPGAPQTPTPSAPPLPSPPVTEQAPPRTPQISRQPVVEPTPPAIGPEDEQPVPEEEQLLELVRRVPGVRDAYHVTSPDGSTSLRLELEDGVDRDEVHASVSAVLSEERAVEPGPQSADDPGERARAEIETVPQVEAEAEAGAVGAVELRRVEINSSGMEAEVTVSLAVGGRETSGAVTVPPVDWHVQHAAAAAAVEALRPHLAGRTHGSQARQGGAEIRVEVEHASIVSTGPVKTAVVVVLWMDGRTVRRLSGAAVVTAERTKAVVTATLSALAGEVAH